MIEEIKKERLYAYDANGICWHVGDLIRSRHKSVDFYDELNNVYRPIAIGLDNAKKSPHFRLHSTMKKSGNRGQTGESWIHRKIKEMFASEKEVNINGQSFNITNPCLEVEYGFYKKGEDRLRAKKWRVIDFECDDFALEVICQHELGYGKEIFLEALGKTIVLVDVWKMIDAFKSPETGRKIQDHFKFTFNDVLNFTRIMPTQKQISDDLIKKMEDNGDEIRSIVSDLESQLTDAHITINDCKKTGRLIVDRHNVIATAYNKMLYWLKHRSGDEYAEWWKAKPIDLLELKNQPKKR